MDSRLATIAGAIAEPARARMLCSLLDGHARTATELSVVAEVSPSTASAHLARLKEDRLLLQLAQGKHRYYQLASAEVAAAEAARASDARPVVSRTPLGHSPRRIEA